MIELSKDIAIEERLEFASLVTFVPNKRVPIHNWFIFKEGFSRDLVIKMVSELNIGKNEQILDPFCGSGTTLLVAKELDIDSCGVDVSPLQVFVSKTKTENYNIEELKEISNKIFSKKFERPDTNKCSKLVKNAFSKYALEDIVFFKKEIDEIDDIKIRNFFTLGLINASTKVSYAYKDGGVIKFRERPTIPFRKIFKHVTKKMIKDLEKLKLGKKVPNVFLGDARRMNFLPDNYFDAVITSPPYLNKIEYTKVYSIESELFFNERGLPSVRSYLGLAPITKNDPFPEHNLPDIAKAYFQDIASVLLEVKRVTRSNAKCAFIIAEGVLPTGVIPSDLLLAKLASKVGFNVEKIIVAARRVVTNEKRQKLGVARESIVIFKK